MELTNYPINKTFPYNGFVIWLNFLVTLPLFLVVLIHPLMHFTVKGIIVTIGFLSIVFTSIVYNIFRNFYRYTKGKPALEITKEYYIDHTINKKIRLKNISEVNLKFRSSAWFLEFKLFNNMIYFEQFKNPIIRYLEKVLSSDSNIQTKLSLIKGKNENLYREISLCLKLKRNY